MQPLIHPWKLGQIPICNPAISFDADLRPRLLCCLRKPGKPHAVRIAGSCETRRGAFTTPPLFPATNSQANWSPGTVLSHRPRTAPIWRSFSLIGQRVDLRPTSRYRGTRGLTRGIFRHAPALPVRETHLLLAPVCFFAWHASALGFLPEAPRRRLRS